ncbi:MAG: BatD family protein [bacterium]
MKTPIPSMRSAAAPGWRAAGMSSLAYTRTDEASSRSHAVLAAMVLCLVACVSCSGGKNTEVAPAAAGIERKVERGPVTAIVKLDKNEISIADKVNLTIEVRAKEDCDIELPPVGDKLEQFSIADYRTSQPKLEDNNEVVTRRIYVLEPFLSGDYVIKPFRISFRKKGEAADVKHEMETEEVTVKVKSLLPETVKALKINDIAPPASLPGNLRPAAWVLGLSAIGLLAVAMAVVAWRLIRRAGRPGVQPVVLPHELAYSRLQALVDEDLVGKGQVKAFYQRISDILRHYIEDRFGLHAPERTTEEFLGELGSGGSLVLQHKVLLKGFLVNCDMVKFAEHQPGPPDIQATFDSCRRFIAETVPTEEAGAKGGKEAKP